MSFQEEEKFRLTEGVFISLATEGKFSDFERNYLATREKEKRVLSIEEIKKLPFVAKNNPDYSLWTIRRKNIFRFLKYLGKKKNNLNILDIGCGNGFFSHLMSVQHHRVIGVDINLFELRQAANSFNSPNLNWYYADILNEEIPGGKFDMITFCCSFQYFQDPVFLLKRCLSLLADGGEIHIIDSPFYTEKTKKTAKENSLKYYKSMDIESMAEYYHHNTYEVLKKFNYQFKYQPNKLLNKLFRKVDSPFPWILVNP